VRKTLVIKIFTVLCLGFSSFSAKSQQVNTMYFMENVPVRNYLNPAFQPLNDFYLGFPVLGYTQLGIGNNSLTLKDFAYNDASGKPIWFMNKNGNKDKFFNVLKPSLLFQANFQINILDVGFRTGKAYWTLSLTEKTEGQMGLPNDLMKFLLYGTPDMDKNSYDFSSLGGDATLYTEAAFGYSRKVNKKLSVGAKLKLLLGTANVSGSINDLKLNAGIDEWRLVGNGSANYSSPVDLNGNSLRTFDPNMDLTLSQLLKPSGIGGGIDFGVVYKLLDELTISAAVNDLGFIRWSKNLKNMNFSTDAKFSGLDYTVKIKTVDDFKDFADSVFNSIKDSKKDSIVSNNAYTTYTSPKLNIGVEYAFLKNKLSVGLLSRTLLHHKVPYEELTASINGRPIDWFNMSLSYSVLNGRMSNIGAGLGLRTGFIHWFLSADYIPVKYATVDLTSASLQANNPVPYSTKGINMALGINFVFGNRLDEDRDGVIDRKDKCPDTPRGVIVDKCGCPVDAESIGDPDYMQKSRIRPTKPNEK